MNQETSGRTADVAMTFVGIDPGLTAPAVCAIHEQGTGRRFEGGSKQMVTLIVPVVPVAQPRQRHAVIGGRVRNYTPTTHPVNTYKAALMLAAKQQGARPLEGPLRVTVRFYLPRPKRLMRKKDPNSPIPHTSRPDIDNLWKSTADALRGLVWHDDAQVTITKAEKWYVAKGETPCVIIDVAPLAILDEEASA